VTSYSHVGTRDVESFEQIQRRRGRRLSRPARDQVVGLTLATAFVTAAALVALLVGTVRPQDPMVFALFVAVYVLLTRVEFEVGVGSAIPTQLVFVPMLFVLPLGWVPLCVGAASLVRIGHDIVRGRRGASSIPLALMSSSYSLGPVIVMALAFAPHDRDPRWNAWPVYGLAIAAQFTFDFGAVWLWLRGIGLARGMKLKEFGSVYAVDLALAPVGLLLAFATNDRPYLVVLILPLVALLALFSREREHRIDAALELGHAYRGTALLLGDVVEADDAYTGEHSRDVVSLTLAVAEQFGLDARQRRTAEFVALLHDVGKIRIPAEIINKPGPLDPDERRIIETHTVEGEAMLTKIGGMLGNVGNVVRSCHERWDGAGYPDRLAGERIPLVARIVCCADAYSAMTADRPYRKALSVDNAIAELRRCAGSQFDPRVVDALVTVVSS
jgi:HD-GYP domain-containing protein (c-di-GMP phosphodiesterase class II)